ncbi:MAG: ABC transporter permease [Desulfovibrio sp.]|nr:ABC transporter permease [Desulfovibrio sp.]
MKNCKGHKAYNAIIVFAVALAVAMSFVAAFMSGGIQKELENTRRLQEPDLALVPGGTKEKGNIYLTKGPPALGAVAADAASEIRGFAGIEAVTSQKYLGKFSIGNVQATLISYEPETDFVVAPWLEKKNLKEIQGRSDKIVLGARVAVGKLPGDSLQLNGKDFLISGRLRESGAFLDSAVFFPVAGTRIEDPSWILLRLTQGVFLDAMVNRIEANIPRVEVITRPEMLKTINDQLHGLVRGGSFGTAAILVAVGALLITVAIFALMIHERRREFGLLKAMGAGNSFVFKLIVKESVLLGGLGGIIGLGLAVFWLLLSGAGLAFGELSALSFTGFILFRMFMTLARTVGVCMLAALFPALLAARLEPYAAIRGGE